MAVVAVNCALAEWDRIEASMLAVPVVARSAMSSTMRWGCIGCMSNGARVVDAAVRCFVGCHPRLNLSLVVPVWVGEVGKIGCVIAFLVSARLLMYVAAVEIFPLVAVADDTPLRLQLFDYMCDADIAAVQ